MYGKLAIALLGIAALFPFSQAQQLRGPAITIPVPTAMTSGGPGIGFGGRAGMGRFHRPALLLGSPYLYADYPSEPGVMEAPPPQVIIVQMPPAAEAAPVEPRPEPLLIELQGDRYVRLTGGANGTAGRGTTTLDYAEPAPSKSMPARPAQQAKPAPPELVPVVLVYRDGHREQIREYTIADGVIYARGDYWTDGFWNKKIQLGALDLPATEKASQGLGSQFVLPTSPNEVMVRP
jgi:hypothetical protein